MFVLCIFGEIYACITIRKQLKRDLYSKAVIRYTLAAEYGTSIFHLAFFCLLYTSPSPRD